MKKLVILSLCLISLVSYSQKVDKGWRNLFNGKDLKGWKQINGTAKYTVENGVLVGTTVKDSPNSFLATEETFGDFILEAEFKMDDETNSGIQFCSETKPDD